ncbi:MAG: cellulase family glycosylhydrolase [Steroidobacter sp.]
MERVLRGIMLWLTALLLLAPLTSNAGFFIQNGRLMDDNGTPFVMRGINYPFAWYTHRYPAQTQQDFANMAATRANTVRIVLTTGGQWTRINGPEIAQLIQWCKDRRMIAVLEVHDSTGWGDSSAAVPISNAVSYWTSADVRAAINGQEDFVIINIANEPFGNNSSANYVNDTIASIQALRNAGLTHNLMVDAANWGQDWSSTLRNSAQQIFNADPLRNITFSVHMYEVYPNVSTVSSYMQAFADMGLPLVVGEFGGDHNGQPVDEAAIMAQAQQRGLGYLGWSWSGNGSCCTQLDIVTDFSTTLTSWGNALINGSNGITATAVPATVFAPPSNNLTVSPTTLSFTAGAGNANVAVTANVSWSATDNASWLTVSPAAGSGNGNVTVSATANTATTARTGVVTVSGASLSRTIQVTQAATGGQPGGNGGVTVTPVVASSGGWFNELQVRVANTNSLTALAVTVIVQRTGGVSYSGMWNNVGGQVQQSNSSTSSAITYQFILASGQTLSPATARQFAVQASGNGTAHPTSGDTYTVTYTTGGAQYTQSGTF